MDTSTAQEAPKQQSAPSTRTFQQAARAGELLRLCASTMDVQCYGRVQRGEPIGEQPLRELRRSLLWLEQRLPLVLTEVLELDVLDNPRRTVFQLSKLVPDLLLRWTPTCRDTGPLTEQDEAFLAEIYGRTTHLAADLEHAVQAHLVKPIEEGPRRRDLESPVSVGDDGLTATVRNATYSLTEHQAAILRCLIDAGGGWVTRKKMEALPGRPSRADRVISRLAKEVRACIESKRGSGYRMRME